MTRHIWIVTLCAAVMACSASHNETVTIDWTKETSVDPKSVAGDYKGITGNVVYHRDFPSEFVASRNIEIWLPPSYEASPQKRYPVLYMHDGQNVFDPSGSKYSGWDWGVDEAMTALISQGKIREAIIVAPHSLEKWRNADYFPEKAAQLYEKEFKAAWPEFDINGFRGDAYLKFLTEELKPYIDQNYRTHTESKDTSIMGSSMGGLISLYAISEYPDIFGAAGNVSTHFPLAEGKLVEYFESRLPDPSTHRLYFDYGTWTLDHNYEGFQDKMDSAVRRTGYKRGDNWTTRKFEGHDHSERSWRNRVHIPLTFLLDKRNIDGGEEK